MHTFENKVAVITGAASGFGREFANIGARLGMKLVLADVQQDALEKAREELALWRAGHCAALRRAARSRRPGPG